MQLLYAIDTEELQRQTNTVNTKELPLFLQNFNWTKIETPTKTIKLKPVGKIIHKELFIILELEDIFLDKKEKMFYIIDDEIYFIIY